MLGVRSAYAVAMLGVYTAVGCAAGSGESGAASGTPGAVAQLYAVVDDARVSRGITPDDREAPASSTTVLDFVADAGTGVRERLPGRTARTVLHEEVNEAENLFFTEDGRLFVSGAEDIYEIKRGADGRFTKTDYFAENCVVEGIVRSQNYLYGACWTLQLDLSVQSYLIGGELTERPAFHIIGSLAKDVVANGLTVDPQGRVYVTYTTGSGEIVRLTFTAPLQLPRKESWARDLPNVNGIKYLNGAVYVTLLNDALASELVRIPVLADGSAGKPEKLYERWLTVLDDLAPFEDGFIITDFLKGTLIFWHPTRGAYAETPAGTFYGPTALAQGRPPLFTPQQLLVPEKGNFLVRDERRGDLLSLYQLP